ncbi:sporulation protein SPS19 [Patellaria atrata CBS 101060]|uniref:2,4-dienoyl-CoA reductase [(3E)-enoyl-CoA-producing] n=1 Tax=Patellaria atrata CBS 101060 TaxID=1346257 RepID=A0A9P4VMN5_9PEZI|nr:sporulation protein SPS19 [Patellaria atrata CBS 101060]
MPVPKHEYVSEVWKDGIFANKVIFCTGGAGTICSMQVRAFVHLGANACIVGRKVEKTEQAAKDLETARAGAKVLGIGEVDVRKYEDLAKAAEKCVKELGGIDFVIAGAAGNFLASINQLSPNAFKTVIDIDVIGSYNTLKATLPYLLKSAEKCKSDGLTPSPNGTGGRIIFISATMHYMGQALQTHVNAAKAGVDALSVAVAIEQGPFGITSNVISPGAIAGTEGFARLSKKGTDPMKSPRIPLGRVGTVRDIADATVYLFSDAGSYVNGEVLYDYIADSNSIVDGGAWHVSGTQPGAQWQYPEFLLSGKDVTDAGGSGGKKSKL